MRHFLYYLSLVSLVMVLLVVLAGSIVRMSGSGMGCPDWPKCFGYYIPPTDIETLTWRPDKTFKKGQMILKDEAFYIASTDLAAGDTFNPDQWTLYTKHDYSIFNPVHTWIEYVNRLIGALSGLPILVFFISSLFYFRKDPLVPVLGGIGLFLLGFAAWLGKLVVDGNLIPHSITYHMFSALGLVAVFAFLSARLRPDPGQVLPFRDKRIVWLAGACMLLMLLQIALGTSVREEIDHLDREGVLDRGLWIEALTYIFKIHRSFSILVFGVFALFAVLIIRSGVMSTLPKLLLSLLVFEILAGVGLAYLGIPALLQPMHLFFAVLLFALLVTLAVQYHRKTQA